MKKWLLVVFFLTAIVSIFVFIKYDGYKGMFDFLKKEEPQQIENSEQPKVEEKQTYNIEEPTIDSIETYCIIVGSFKNKRNAQELYQSIPFSDIIETNDGWYRVSKNYYFNYEDAKKERDSIGSDTWVLKKYIFFEK